MNFKNRFNDTMELYRKAPMSKRIWYALTTFLFSPIVFLFLTIVLAMACLCCTFVLPVMILKGKAKNQS